MTVVVLVALVILPYELCVPFFGKNHGDFLLYSGTSIDFILFLEILVTFNIGLVSIDPRAELGAIVTDRRVIARTYLRSWFIPDLLSTLPLQLLEDHHDDDSLLRGHTSLRGILKLFRLLKLLRCCKLVRLLKGLNSQSKWDDDHRTEFAATAGKSARLALTIILIAHYAACVFVALANGDHDGWHHNTWVSVYFNAGRQLKRHEENFAATTCAVVVRGGFPSQSKLYVVALYWAMTTLTTIGFGDVVPVTQLEMVWTMIVQFLGSCVL